MSDLFESEDKEGVSTRSNRPIQQRNAIIALLIAIIAILVVILLVKGCDDDSDTVVAPITTSTEEQSSSDSQPADNDTPADTEPATEEEPEPTTEDEIEDPPPIPEDPESLILLADYEWMDSETSEATTALQELLGLDADGWYGIGTRAAHLAALEEKGLPTDNVPTCDLTVGEELCGVQLRTPMENALATLTAGMGEPDNQSEWGDCNDAGYDWDWPYYFSTVSWGVVTAHFAKGSFSASNGGAWGPWFSFWEISNTFANGNWQVSFPNEVEFAESLWIDWEWDQGDYFSPSLTVTDTVIPGGALLEPYLEDFEENIGQTLPLVGDEPFKLLITNKYSVANLIEPNEQEGYTMWRWSTSEADTGGLYDCWPRMYPPLQ